MPKQSRSDAVNIVSHRLDGYVTERAIGFGNFQRTSVDREGDPYEDNVFPICGMAGRAWAWPDFGYWRVRAMGAAEEAGQTSSLAPQRKRSLVVCASKR